MHGEYISFFTGKAIAPGSPPHAWGIQSSTTSESPSGEDHPHMHGEYLDCPEKASSVVGSPPHAWGILCPGPTPGCGIEDHPHMHGEYTKRSLLRRDPYILKSYFLMSFSASCIVAFASDKALCGCSFSIPYFASIVPR